MFILCITFLNPQLLKGALKLVERRPRTKQFAQSNMNGSEYEHLILFLFFTVLNFILLFCMNLILATN